MLGGMWAVAYTDVFQLVLVAIGLAVALPFVLTASAACGRRWRSPAARRWCQASSAASKRATGRASVVVGRQRDADLGGVPWNCYFQRVLSCRTPGDAQAHSILSGVLTIALTVPPLLMGLVAFAYPWPPELAARLSAQPADAMPLIFEYAVPPVDGLARPRRDRRRGHLELLVVDPVGGIDVRAGTSAGACCGPTCRCAA